jgi:HEAT repeat protein
MLTRSCLKLLSAVLLSFVPVLGTAGVARSEMTVKQPANQSQTININQLIQQLKAGDLDARFNAAQTLSKIGESAVPRLLPLLKDDDRLLRLSAAVALRGMGELAKSAIPDLIPLLKDQDGNVRAIATLTLGQMGTLAKPAIPDLILLLKDKEGRVRSIAIDALGQVGGLTKSVIPNLTPLPQGSG